MFQYDLRESGSLDVDQEMLTGGRQRNKRNLIYGDQRFTEKEEVSRKIIHAKVIAKSLVDIETVLNLFYETNIAIPQMLINCMNIALDFDVAFSTPTDRQKDTLLVAKASNAYFKRMIPKLTNHLEIYMTMLSELHRYDEKILSFSRLCYAVSHFSSKKMKTNN